jgi:hypothetical protein
MKISPACQAAHSINSQDDINQIILKFRQNAVVNRVDLVPLAACGDCFGSFQVNFHRAPPLGLYTAEGGRLRFFFEIVDCVTHGLPGRL